jgi:uncharacterized protein YeaO (DUF488 family)
MSLVVYTARISTRDPDRFDVTRKGAHDWAKKTGRPEHEAPSHPFAPSIGLLMATKRGELSFGEYEPRYLAEMRQSYRRHRSAWSDLLARARVAIFCYCVDPLACHRSLLADILGKLGAHVQGELPNQIVPCASCRRPVEPARHCYAIPTCYACLPPPEPLPIVKPGATSP